MRWKRAGARPIACGTSFNVEKFGWHPAGMFLRCEATRGANKGEAGVTLVSVDLAVIKLGVTVGFRTGKKGVLVEAFGCEHATTFVATAGCGGGGLVNDSHRGGGLGG